MKALDGPVESISIFNRMLYVGAAHPIAGPMHRRDAA
jgi:hypothetical protein